MLVWDACWVLKLYTTSWSCNFVICSFKKGLCEICVFKCVTNVIKGSELMLMDSSSWPILRCACKCMWNLQILMFKYFALLVCGCTCQTTCFCFVHYMCFIDAWVKLVFSFWSVGDLLFVLNGNLELHSRFSKPQDVCISFCHASIEIIFEVQELQVQAFLCKGSCQCLESFHDWIHHYNNMQYFIL